MQVLCPSCRNKASLLVHIRRDLPAFIFTFIGSIFAAVSLIIVAQYTFVSRGQWQQMIEATNAAVKTGQQIERQTGLLQDQLSATQAAIVVADINLGGGQDPTKLSLHWNNKGHAISSFAHIDLHIQKWLTSSNSQTGKNKEFGNTVGQIQPQPIVKEPIPIYLNSLLSSDDIEQVGEGKETVVIWGNYEFDNGFERTVTDKVCRQIVGLPQTTGVKKTSIEMRDCNPSDYEKRKK